MSPVLRVLGLVFLATSGWGAAIEGDISFTLGTPSSRAAFSRTFGDDLKVKCEWRAINLMGRQMLFAGISVKNAGSNSLWFVYSVAFFDKDRKLVGSAASQLFSPDPLEPGQTYQLPCVVYLPPERYKDIASYQAILYELDKPLNTAGRKRVLLEDPLPITTEVQTNKTSPSLPQKP